MGLPQLLVGLLPGVILQVIYDEKMPSTRILLHSPLGYLNVTVKAATVSGLNFDASALNGSRIDIAHPVSTNLTLRPILHDRLRLIFEWYKGMVDENIGRLLYLYDPESDGTIGDGEPIRDIATVWDIEALSVFLGRDELQSLIRR